MKQERIRMENGRCKKHNKKKLDNNNNIVINITKMTVTSIQKVNSRTKNRSLSNQIIYIINTYQNDKKKLNKMIS